MSAMNTLTGDNTQTAVSNTVAAATVNERGRSSTRASLTSDDLCQALPPPLGSMPMLEASLDRLPKILSERLEQTWKLRARIAGRLALGATPDDEQATAGRALTAGFSAADLPGFGALSFESSMVWLLLDALLGGRAAPTHADQRQVFSHLERCLMRSVADQVLVALTQAFAPVATVRFGFECWQETPAGPPSGKAIENSITYSLDLEIDGRQASLKIALPLTMLAAHFDKFSAAYPGESLGRDTEWRRHFDLELRSAQVDVDAILHEALLPFREIGDLKAGGTLSLGVPADGRVEMRAGGLCIYRGRLGRSGKHVAVRIEDVTPVRVGAGS